MVKLHKGPDVPPKNMRKQKFI